MGARWLLAVAAYSGLAWAGIVYGACNQELLQKLLDRGFSNDEILQMCGRPLEVPNTPSRPPDRPPTELRESQERKRGRGLLSVSRKISKITSKSIRRMTLVVQ